MLNDLITKNLGWKILSIILAVLLWIIVINSQDPVDSKEFKAVPVQIQNADKITSQNKYIDYKEGKTVNITLRGKRKALDKLTKSDIIATADMELISLTGAVPIQIEAGEDFQVIDKKPTHLMVNLEDIITIQRNVEYTFEGDPAQNYMTKDVSLTPNNIEITGPASKIGKVRKVEVAINVEDAKEGITLLAEPKIYDYDGVEIIGLEKNVDKVEVNVPIYKKKIIPVQYTIEKDMEPNYVLTDYKIAPDKITVIGEPDQIDTMESVVLPPISLKGLTEDTTLEYDIKKLLPEGITLWSNENTIQVGLTIEKEIEVTMYLPVESLTVKSLPEGMQFRFVTEEDIPVTLQAVEETINALTSDSLVGTVDLKGLDIGIHEMPVDLLLPYDVRLAAAQPSIQIELLKAVEEDRMNDMEEESKRDL